LTFTSSADPRSSSISKVIPIYRTCKKGETIIVGGVPIKVISGKAMLLFLPTVRDLVSWGIDKPKKSDKVKVA
jgi:hypothetical protein